MAELLFSSSAPSINWDARATAPPWVKLSKAPSSFPRRGRCSSCFIKSRFKSPRSGSLSRPLESSKMSRSLASSKSQTVRSPASITGRASALALERLSFAISRWEEAWCSCAKRNEAIAYAMRSFGSQDPRIGIRAQISPIRRLKASALGQSETQSSPVNMRQV